MIENCHQTTDLVDCFGERDGARTHDLLIKSQLLYQLSYALASPAWGGSRNAAEPIDAPPTGQ